MEPCEQPQSSTGCADTDDTGHPRHIPWWHDLDPTVIAELELPPCDTLPPQQLFDVIVIGGGVAGLSAALSAQAAGAQVVILEKEAELGYGATGRNAGILSAGTNSSFIDLSPDDPVFTLWFETTRVLLTLVEEAQLPDSILSARLTGALCLAESKSAAHSLEREARARLAAGLHAELWTPLQAEQATGGRLNIHSVVSALWLPDEGRIHPLTLLAHLASQARRMGVYIIGQAHVSTYQEVQDVTSSRYWQATLANGRVIKAHGLINATGPTAQPNSRLYALSFSADLPDTFPLFWDASPYFYADFRPGNGRLAVSGGRYGKAGITRRDAHFHQRLADAARRWLPELAGQEPRFTWAVDLAVTANMIPTLRPLARTPGVAVEGLGALGVLSGIALGHRAGQLVADQISA